MMLSVAGVTSPVFIKMFIFIERFIVEHPFSWSVRIKERKVGFAGLFVKKGHLGEAAT
jgi:hypothetical protein